MKLELILQSLCEWPFFFFFNHQRFSLGIFSCMLFPLFPTGQLMSLTFFCLAKAEGIKQRWQEYTEELHKKDLHDPDNHDGVITDLEPDILECEVK